MSRPPPNSDDPRSERIARREPTRESRAAAAVGAAKKDLDGLLKAYVGSPTQPGMPAVRPGMLPLTPYTDLDDEEPVTGQFVVEPGSEPMSLVRDRGVLVRVDGLTAGRIATLPQDAARVGRSPGSDIHLIDNGVSRHHARVYFEYGQYRVEDLGSTNGTWVAGQRISVSQLQEGDHVQFGPRASFRFAWMDETQEQIMHRLYVSSVLDPLTGAANRQHFQQRLEAELAYARRHGTELSLILFDIDYFKRINDGHGHIAGDAVLAEIARSVMASLRTEDIFARYGGEEFVAVLRGISLTGAMSAAERVRKSIAGAPIAVGHGTVDITISAGCSALSETKGAATELLKLADDRLYRAKRSGRNRVVGG